MALQINHIYNQDCLEGLKDIESVSVDLIIADPPYGIRFGENEGLYNRPKEGVLEGYIDVPSHQYKSFSKDWIKECYRVLKNTGSIYVVSGWQQVTTIEACMKEAGFIIINHISWVYQFGVNTKKKFVTAYNPIIFAVKNEKKYEFHRNCRYRDDEKLANGNSALYKDLENVWYITKERWEKKVTTPTRLPYELVKKMVQYSSKEGDLILDPFMGSGQTAFVGKDLNRNFLGFEKNSTFWKFATERLKSNRYVIPLKDYIDLRPTGQNSKGRANLPLELKFNLCEHQFHLKSCGPKELLSHQDSCYFPNLQQNKQQRGPGMLRH